jgi:DNA polymerase IV (archaeal DinB-like DNA polymerase)
VIVRGANDNSTSRIILHVDFDYFFAQCEEIRKPELKDKPVVVCVFSGRTKESGVVSTANYVARRHRIKSGSPIKVAKLRLAKIFDAVFLPVDLDYYSQLSANAMSIINSYSDKFEQVGMDECYLDVSEKFSDFDDAKILAINIKSNVKKHTRLTCTIGIGPNKLLAKIASDMNKPDGLTIITPGSAAELLKRMDVDKLPGIGPKTKERLYQMGLKTIGNLAKMDLFTLSEEFGKKNATYMHNASLGINDARVEDSSQKQQIGRIVTLKNNATKSIEMHPNLYQLCQSVFQTTISRRLSFKSIGILLILDNLESITRSKSLKVHSNSFDILHSTAKTILNETMAQISGIKVRRLGLKISELQSTVGQDSILDFIDSKN